MATPRPPQVVQNTKNAKNGVFLHWVAENVNHVSEIPHITTSYIFLHAVPNIVAVLQYLATPSWPKYKKKHKNGNRVAEDVNRMPETRHVAYSYFLYMRISNIVSVSHEIQYLSNQDYPKLAKI